MKCRSFLLFVLAFSLLPVFGCKPNPEALRLSLMSAVKADNTQDARKLIKKGADANSRDSVGGWSALHYAARNANAEIVQALLRAGADPNYDARLNGGSNGNDPYNPLALAKGTIELVRKLSPAEVENLISGKEADNVALRKSIKDPRAKDRYQEVIDILTKVTKAADEGPQFEYSFSRF